MLDSVTIAVIGGAMGFLSGAFLPAVVAYAILFVRRHGRHVRTFLGLGWRLLVALLLFSLAVGLLVGILHVLGVSDERALESNSLFVSVQIGFWGSIVALIVGRRMARKNPSHHSQTP